MLSTMPGTLYIAIKWWLLAKVKSLAEGLDSRVAWFKRRCWVKCEVLRIAAFVPCRKRSEKASM